jgi:signal peptidase I
MIISRNILIVFVIVSFTILGLCLTAMFIFGQYGKFYVVFSDSMIPNLNTGDIVFVENEDHKIRSSFDKLKIGDIIVFKPGSSAILDQESAKTIVHRVIEVEIDPNGTRVIRTKGDANPYSIQSLDYPIIKEDYIGKVIHVIRYLGLLLMYFDILIRVLIQPIFYVIIGAVVSIILFLELRKRHLSLKNLNDGAS